MKSSDSMTREDLIKSGKIRLYMRYGYGFNANNTVAEISSFHLFT